MYKKFNRGCNPDADRPFKDSREEAPRTSRYERTCFARRYSQSQVHHGPTIFSVSQHTFPTALLQSSPAASTSVIRVAHYLGSRLEGDAKNGIVHQLPKQEWISEGSPTTPPLHLLSSLSVYSSFFLPEVVVYQDDQIIHSCSLMCGTCRSA